MLELHRIIQFLNTKENLRFSKRKVDFNYIITFEIVLVTIGAGSASRSNCDANPSFTKINYFYSKKIIIQLIF